MADRTHFYKIEKPDCDKECQRYDPKQNCLYYCKDYMITTILPTGDHDPITKVNGICIKDIRRKK
jgi:hypothetical protein